MDWSYGARAPRPTETLELKTESANSRLRLASSGCPLATFDERPSRCEVESRVTGFQWTAFLHRQRGNPGARATWFRHLTLNRDPTAAEGSICKDEIYRARLRIWHGHRSRRGNRRRIHRSKIRSIQQNDLVVAGQKLWLRSRISVKSICAKASSKWSPISAHGNLFVIGLAMQS